MLSDLDMEDALVEVPTMRRTSSRVLEEDASLSIRHLLEKHNLGDTSS